MSIVSRSVFRTPLLSTLIGLSLTASPLLHAESATAYASSYGGHAAHITPYNQAATAPASHDDDEDSQSSPECTVNYYRGDAPNFVNLKLATNTTELCFDGFTVMYSGLTRTPLWSAEHLTRARIENAEVLSRLNNFHEESQLPVDIRSTLADYKSSGFDRGHMSPNGDMGTRAQQFNSFSLANIVPQDSYNNQNPWRLLEEATRELVKEEGEAYVITGAAFLGDNLRQIGNVIVPSHIFKAVYFPSEQAVGVYFSPNDASGQVQVITLAELNAKIGLDLMPSLPDQVKQRRVDMPLNTTWANTTPRETKRKASNTSDRSPRHYGVSTSQLLPSKRVLWSRIWKALKTID